MAVPRLCDPFIVLDLDDRCSSTTPTKTETPKRTRSQPSSSMAKRTSGRIGQHELCGDLRPGVARDRATPRAPPDPGRSDARTIEDIELESGNLRASIGDLWPICVIDPEADMYDVTAIIDLHNKRLS